MGKQKVKLWILTIITLENVFLEMGPRVKPCFHSGSHTETDSLTKFTKQRNFPIILTIAFLLETVNQVKDWRGWRFVIK